MSLTRAGALVAARNLIFAGTGSASALLLLALLIIAGRMLGDDAFGRFSFALALATILEVLMDFGLKEVVTRSVARDRTLAARLVAHAYGVKLLLSTVGLALLTLAAFLLRPEPEMRLACVLMGVSAVLRSYLLTVRHLFNGMERFGLDSIVLTADRTLLLIFGVVALWLGYGVIGLATAFVIARSVAFGLAHFLARRQIGPIGIGFERTYWWELLRMAAPFGLFVAVLNLYSYIDTLMLGVLRTDQEVGLYNASYRVYEGVVNLASIVGTVTGPRLARDFVHHRGHHAWLARLTIGGTLALAVPIGLGIAFYAPAIVAALFGSEFAPSAGVLRILVLGLVFVFPLQVMHTVAISVNRERSLVRAAIVGCVANIVLNGVLIPSYGMFGSAVATVISEAVSLVMILAAVRSTIWSAIDPGVASRAEGPRE